MDMKFDTMRILNVVDGKDPEAAAAIIGKAIIESVTTAEKMFKGNLELDITDSLVERIDTAKPKNFHQQLRERMARHNSVEIPEETKQPKRRGRPKKNK
jgi:hypothetical protein